MTTIRRNVDGRQNLTDLRRALAASSHRAYRQGGNWVAQKWSESHDAYIERPMPPRFDERMTIQWLLLGAPEHEDQVMYHARSSKTLSNAR
jgi:hypothetical protein